MNNNLFCESMAGEFMLMYLYRLVWTVLLLLITNWLCQYMFTNVIISVNYPQIRPCRNIITPNNERRKR